MSFTLKSEKLIKHFIDDFDKYCVKKTARVQKTTDNILKMIYRDIRISESYINMIKESNILQTDIKEIKTLKEMPKTNLMDNQFMPGSIKDKILYNILGYMKGTLLIRRVKVNIYYGLFKKEDFKNLKKIKNNILDAFKIVKFCILNKGLSQVKSLDIYLYLTDEDKKVPKNPVLVLGSNNCNSAVTFACATNGKLLIYRKEEWKKVLIHELFHSLCLDFAVAKYDKLKGNIKKIFDVDSDFEISEAYSEYWATILNSCFISYSLLDDDSNIDNFLLFTDFCIQLERIFSLFQMNKMLHHMGLNYSNLYKNDSISISYREILYKEDTNVLAYYIIKTIMLFNSDDFLKWCLLNNATILKFDKTEQNFFKLYKFVKDNYNKKMFTDAVTKMDLFYKKKLRLSYKQRFKNDFVISTGRMSICEN